MKQPITKIIRNRIVLSALFIGVAGIAFAGAPSPDEDKALDSSVKLIVPVSGADPALDLSPAEIRNLVSIRMDRAAAQGFDVDRAAVDGIGLEPRRPESFVEAPSP